MMQAKKKIHLQARNQDLTTGPLAKQILFFSIPLMFSNILQVLFNMADVAVVGRFAGAMALGSVGSTTILVTMFTGFLIGFSGGINVIVALHFGAGDDESVGKTVHSAVILSVVTGLALLLIGLGFSRTILTMLNTKPELIDGAMLYIRIYFLGMPALALYNFGNAVFSAVGDTGRPLRYLTLAGIVNIILNLILVIVFQLGVAGVAIASVVSQVLSASLILIALFRSDACYRLRLKELRYDPSRGKEIMKIGIPAGVQNAIFYVANLFIQSAVNSFSAIVVAGNAAATNADALVYDVMSAFYTACGSFMGQNYGARNKERIRKSYFYSLFFAFGIGSAMGLTLVLFGRPFLRLFTTDEEVIFYGMYRLVIMGCSYGFSAFMDAAIAACRALGKGLVPTIIVILGSCIFRIIWVYTVFAHFKTIPSLYLLYICSWLITAAAENIYFAKVYRETVSVL